MSICDLPPELFQQILTKASDSKDIPSMIKLRLVNKWWQQNIEGLLLSIKSLKISAARLWDSSRLPMTSLFYGYNPSFAKINNRSLNWHMISMSSLKELAFENIKMDNSSALVLAKANIGLHSLSLNNISGIDNIGFGLIANSFAELKELSITECNINDFALGYMID